MLIFLTVGLFMRFSSPKLSIDKLALLFKFSVLDDDRVDIGVRHLHSLESILTSVFDGCEFMGSTENYVYQYKTKRGLNIQYEPKRQKRLKAYREEILLINRFESNLQNRYGIMYKDVYDNVDQDYNLRIEYNPNRKPHQLSGCALSFLAHLSKGFSFEKVKVGRIDWAIDYFQPVNLGIQLVPPVR